MQPILPTVTVTGTYQKNTNIYTATVADIPNYDIYTITANSSFTVVNDISVNIMFYAVGGGGGPGAVGVTGRLVGGGGSGGIVTGNVILYRGTYNVVVGAGGLASYTVDTPSSTRYGQSTYINNISNFPIAGGGGVGGAGLPSTDTASSYFNGYSAPAGGGSGGGNGIRGTSSVATETRSAYTFVSGASATNNRVTFPLGEAYQPNSHITTRGGSLGSKYSTLPLLGRGGGAGGNTSDGNSYGNGIVLSASSISQLYWDSVIGLGGPSSQTALTAKENTGDGGIGAHYGNTLSGSKGFFIMAVPKPTFTCLDITSMGIAISTGGNVAHLNQCWFRTVNASKQYLFYKSSTGYACGINANGNPFVQYNGTTVTITTVNVADNVWHHMAMVCVPNATLKILIDGSISSTTIVTTSLSTVTSVRMFNNGTLGSEQFIGQVYNIRSINLNATALYTSSITNETIAKDRRLIYSRPFANYNAARLVDTGATPELESSRIITSIPCQDLTSGRFLNNYTTSSTPTTILPTGTGYGITSIPYSRFQP